MNSNYPQVNTRQSFFDRMRPNIIWIILVTVIWYVFLALFLHIPYELLMFFIRGYVTPEWYFTLELYGSTIADILTLFILCWCFRKNRYIWKSFLPPGKTKLLSADDLLSEDDACAILYGRRRNGFKMLGIGLLLGFLTNFFCVLCALLHGDIHLYFEASLSQIPYFLISLLFVTIQSSAEEVWCRGFMYERLHERYPLWVSVAVNGAFFGMLHIFNPGASVVPIIGIVICGLSYSLIRWYSGSIWTAMGIHAGWNFTQNYLFGLPNSGLVSEASIFHLDSATGISTWIYDWAFGVEGGVPSLFIDALVGFIIIIMAVRNGRIKELGMSRIPALESMGMKMRVERSEDKSVVSSEDTQPELRSDTTDQAE